MSAAPPDPRRAENDLWHALEERRDEIRAAGLGFSERQHHHLREAHAARRLIAELNASMEKRASGASGDSYYLRPMAQAIQAGFQPWEELITRTDETWTEFFTSRARQGARQAIDDAKAYIPFL